MECAPSFVRSLLFYTGTWKYYVVLLYQVIAINSNPLEFSTHRNSKININCYCSAHPNVHGLSELFGGESR